MLNRFFNLIRNLFISKDTINILDESYDEEIKNKERNLKLFYEIVGENPLKQIDWIIENGFEKFNELFRSYENGSIGRSAANYEYKVGSIDASTFQSFGCTTEETITAMEFLLYNNRQENSNSSKTNNEFRVNLSTVMPFHGQWREDGTHFEELYKIFKRQLNHYNPQEVETTEEELHSILVKAIDYFKSCRKNIRAWNVEVTAFKEKLDDDEKSILAKLMVYSHINKLFLIEENLKSCLNSKDYRLFSPANQLKTLQAIREQIRLDCTELQIKYSWDSDIVEAIELRGGIGNKVIARYEESSLYGDIFS